MGKASHRRADGVAHPLDVAPRRSGCRSTRTMQAAMAAISAAPMPRVVTAGVPMRMPLVTKGPAGVEGDGVFVDGDPGPAQGLLGILAGDAEAGQVQPASCGCRCRRRPGRPRRPSDPRPGPRRFGRCGSGRPGSRRCRASLKATALAAMTCISGPPWMPGKISRLSRSARSGLGQDQAAPGAPQGLVGGGGDHVGQGDRGRVQVRGHQARRCGPCPPSDRRPPTGRSRQRPRKSMMRG